jgi:CDP-diacylglycerol---glycerol-3-phosphate 3-phosphatidyltransferase
MSRGSLLTPEQRASFRARIEPMAKVFGRVGLTPNALTVIGFLIAIVAAVSAAAQAWFVAGLLVGFGSAFDLFDGALARATGTASTFGAFLDSTLDRAGEAVAYIGIVVGLAGYLEPGASVVPGVLAASAAMGASFMVSYARAKSESLGFSPGTGMANVGLAPREVRAVILTIGLIIAGLIRPGTSVGSPGSVSWWYVLVGALALIATLATITTLQRILVVRRQSQEREKTMQAAKESR